MFQTTLNRSRNDKFILIIDLPKALKNSFDQTSKEFFNIEPLQLSIYGSPVPQISVPNTNLSFGGQVYKTSSFSRPEYNPLTVKFLVDNGYKNYWTLWNWLNLFNDAKTSTSTAQKSITYNLPDEDITLINSMNDYTANFSIYGLDEFNKKIISFVYKNAFPTNLSELNFSNQDPSEINCTVTFVFNQLHVELVKNINESTC